MYGLIDYAHRRCLNRICIYIRIFVCANLTRKKIESFDETNILKKASRLILNNRRKKTIIYSSVKCQTAYLIKFNIDNNRVWDVWQHVYENKWIVQFTLLNVIFPRKGERERKENNNDKTHCISRLKRMCMFVVWWY